MYNASKDFLDGFSMPKLRGGGEVVINFTAFAFNEDSGAAEGYMEFQDTLWSNNLVHRFEDLGASSVDFLSFQHNDGNHSAASAYNRVRKIAGNPGFTLITSGSPNTKLLAKANDLLENEKLAKSASQEFDEKTQEAIKHSLNEITQSMVTKNDFQNLGASSQKNFEEIKNRLKTDYEQIIVSKVRTILEQEETIKHHQQMIEMERDRNYRQSCVLARLNHERDETAKELKAKNQLIIEQDLKILKLQEENHSLKFADSAQDEIKTMLTELCEESKKKQQDDEMKMMLTEVWHEVKRQRTQP